MGAPRIFTLTEAEATLPLVRRIVEDLLTIYPRWREAVARYELITGGARAVETPDLRAAREAVTRDAIPALHTAPAAAVPLGLYVPL